jgi:hypothetical protein
MEVPVATNFNDFVALSAAHSPHGLVMDCWRRLDLALREYCNSIMLVVDRWNPDAIEKAVSQDQALGQGVASRIRELRQRRNRVAHESIYLSSEDATAYSKQAFSLLATLGRRVSGLGNAA